jgi:glutamine synthetase adenylyltransferase
MTVLLSDHHGARFFEKMGPSGGLEEREHLQPKDPHGFLRHLEHRKEADYQGQRIPEADEFYERVAQRLKGSPSILLVGDAAGKSSALRYLSSYLNEKHKDIIGHIVGTEDADLSAITLGQIEEIARRH